LRIAVTFSLQPSTFKPNKVHPMPDRLSRKTDHGFTLIEIVVVLALVTLLLTVAVPRLAENAFIDPKRKTSLWITKKIHSLKAQSISQARDHTLHIDLTTGQMWTTHAGQPEEEATAARQAGHTLPEGALIEGVEFPRIGLQTSGQADVQFFKTGYSQKALILIGFDDGSRRSFLIEPFLPKVKLYEEPFSINQ
jgi:prepilin-type N-terminal cleavage/methylation domain-containing protein